MSNSTPHRRDDDPGRVDAPPTPDDNSLEATMPIGATIGSGPKSEDTISGGSASVNDSTDPGVAPTMAQRDVSDFPATVELPTGVMETIDHVAGSVKRKAAAVLHT